jgi:NAD(P)-dependent dehydrogenase (short-subunit alcohol dehydrogenase family)
MSQPASLSSRGHQFAGVDFDDPNFQTRAYERRIAQGQSKTANALFAVNLDAIGKPHGVGAFSVHPGDVITDLTRYMLADESCFRLHRRTGSPHQRPGPKNEDSRTRRGNKRLVCHQPTT